MFIVMLCLCLSRDSGLNYYSMSATILKNYHIRQICQSHKDVIAANEKFSSWTKRAFLYGLN